MGNFMWALALLFSIQIGFRTSGAQMNPAVTWYLFLAQELTFSRFLAYAAAQFLGAFVGAALCFLVYYDLIDQFDGGKRQVHGPKKTAHIFATYPQDYLSVRGMIVDQVVTTALLCIFIRSITKRRHGVPKAFQPYLLGLSLAVLTVGFAQNCGCAINPARDLAPRVFSYFVGYGWGVFSYRGYSWFWVPVVCPMIGAAIGCALYKFFIGNFVPDLDADEVVGEMQKMTSSSEHIITTEGSTVLRY